MAANPTVPDAIGSNRYSIGTNIDNPITATPSGTQATSYLLQAQINKITSVATALDGVLLPEVQPFDNADARPGMLGFFCYIINATANSVTVFPAVGDTINGVTSATGIVIPGKGAALCVIEGYTQSTTTGTWSAVVMSGAGQLLGTQTNDSAAAGNVGEFLTTTVASGAAVAETTATPVDVCTLSLTAGDWDVSAVVDRTLTGTTATIYGAGISLTLNTLPTQPGGSGLGTDALVTQAATFGTTVTGVGSTVIPPVRVSLAATTTLHLVAGDTFSAGSVAVFGTIRARRVR